MQTGALSARDNVERFLLPALAGPQRIVPLKSLASKDLSHLALVSAAKRGQLQSGQDLATNGIRASATSKSTATAASKETAVARSAA